MKKILKNCRVVDNGNATRRVNITIENGRIKAIKAGILDEAAEVIDIHGALVVPGLVDLHVHLREPGYEYKETIKTGTLAATHGGYTTVCAMPNLDPVPDTAERVAAQVALNQQESVVKLQQYAALTQGRTSETSVDYAALAAAGAFAFSNDGSGVQTAAAMFLAMQATARLGKPIAAHAEDTSLMAGGLIRESTRAAELQLRPWSPLTESAQLARDLALAEATGVHYHLCHASTKQSVQLIREAKTRGVHVTAEVCPHHLLLAVEDIPEDDGNYKMNPPLPMQEDQAALLEGLLDGTIDCIATDHAPHSAEEKAAGFVESPFGIVGSETAFALLYTALVEKGQATLEQLIDWMSLAPARLFGLDAGDLQVGNPADLAVFDIERPYQIDAKDFLSKGKNTPFLGWEVKGETLLTLVDGEVVWEKVRG